MDFDNIISLLSQAGISMNILSDTNRNCNITSYFPEVRAVEVELHCDHLVKKSKARIA